MTLAKFFGARWNDDFAATEDTRIDGIGARTHEPKAYGNRGFEKMVRRRTHRVRAAPDHGQAYEHHDWFNERNAHRDAASEHPARDEDGRDDPQGARDPERDDETRRRPLPHCRHARRTQPDSCRCERQPQNEQSEAGTADGIYCEVVVFHGKRTH